MLGISTEAAEAINQIAAETEAPDDAGIRITAQPVSDKEFSLSLSLAPAPDESDEVVEEEGAQVFVEPQLADFLDDKVLDAAVVGEEVQFSLRPAAA